MLRRHLMRGLVPVLVGGLVWLGCSETTGGGEEGDQNAPTVTLTLADTLVNINEGLRFTVSASDNISLLTVGWSVRGAVNRDTLVAFTQTTPAYSQEFTIDQGFTGGTFTLSAFATDGSGNTSDTVVATARVFDDRAPTSILIFPEEQDRFSAGDVIPAVANATDPSGVAQIIVSLFSRDQFDRRVVISADTLDVTASPLPTSVEDTLNVAVPDITPGTYELGVFAVDGATPARSGNGDSITVRIIDTNLPMVTFVLPDPAAPPLLVRIGDSVRVHVQLDDTQGLSKLTLDGLAFRGDPLLGTDTIVTRFAQKTVDDLNGITDTLVRRDLIALEDERTGELVSLQAIVEDASGNADTATVQVQVVSGPALTILDPVDGGQVPVGLSTNIRIRAESDIGVKEIGFFTSGVLVAGDTIPAIPLASQQKDTTHTFSLLIPGGTPLGFMQVIPVGRDENDEVGTGDPITLEIVAALGATDTLPPVVSRTIEERVEVDDTIRIDATDLGGVASVGFIVTDLSGASTLSTDTVTFGGGSTNETGFLALGLDTVSTFPRQVVITAFATDQVANRGETSIDGVTPVLVGLTDTLTVVAGITKSLPVGGVVADAILHPGFGAEGELYLTNIERDQIEVFDIATRTFNTAIPIGSRPWGVALWPRSTDGTPADTIVVANSGGTNLSIVDLVSKSEVRRHQLPIFLVQSVNTRQDAATGLIEFEIKEFDLADRPQHLGMVCEVTGVTTNCDADSVYAVYSTAPTPAQSERFANRSTLRWENLSICFHAGKDCDPAGGSNDSAQSYFVYNHATEGANQDADTLQVLVHRCVPGGGSGSCSPSQTETIVFAGAGVMADFDELGFQDTVFVRNSGDFTHALIGEGDNVQFARTLAYDVRAMLNVQSDSFNLNPNPFDTAGANWVSAVTWTDQGVSPAVRVRDFIANSATPIRAIGTNFNGLTNIVRADSVYVLDEVLRLQGVIQTPLGTNSGLDINSEHNFDARAGATGASPANDNRIVFVALDTPEIALYDTWHFGEIRDGSNDPIRVPIRDPIIGPLRVARLPGGQQLVVGVTEKGVVTVTMPAIANHFPDAPGRIRVVRQD